MRALATALGVSLILLGALWLLQEYNFIPGSFLSSQVSFAHRGAISLGAGIVFMILSASGSYSRS